MKYAKIKPCPFCGGMASSLWNRRGELHEVTIMCMVCGVKGRSFITTEEPIGGELNKNSAYQAAKYFWNNRYSEKETDDSEADIAEDIAGNG